MALAPAGVVSAAMRNPFSRFKSSPEVIRLVVMMNVKYPLSLRNVEDLLHERGIDICHETVRHWWNRFGPMFAAEIRKKQIEAMRGFAHWRWHLDEMVVKVNGETRYLWRAVAHEGEVLESFATTARDKEAALKFMKKLGAIEPRAKLKSFAQAAIRHSNPAVREGGADLAQCGLAEDAFCSTRPILFASLRPLGVRSRHKEIWKPRLAVGPASAGANPQLGIGRAFLLDSDQRC